MTYSFDPLTRLGLAVSFCLWLPAQAIGGGVHQGTYYTTTLYENLAPPVEPGLPVEGSFSVLTRTHDAICSNVLTFGMPEGTYTFWWNIFNRPRACKYPYYDATGNKVSDCSLPLDVYPGRADESLIYGGAFQVGADGVAQTHACLPKGAANAPNGVFRGEGLKRPKRAEVHVILRHHGPADPDPVVFREQLTTLDGGCPPATCRNPQVGFHSGERRFQHDDD